MSAPAPTALHDFGGRERARNCSDVRLPRRFHNGFIKARAGDEHRAGIEALPGDAGIQHGTRAYDGIGMPLAQARHNLKRTRNGHGDLDNRYSTADYRLGGKESVIRGSHANGGY